MKFALVWFMMFQNPSFKEMQVKHERVKLAYTQKVSTIHGLFETATLEFKGFHLFIRAFKKEEELEVWIKQKGEETFSLLHTYNFCTSSGTLGPKRKEGDLQIPEGVYHINHFNPQSNFHLSLGLNYPNAADKILSHREHPGGAIYIHGNCVTIGCIPITDDKIKELYILAVEAKNNGQDKIPIHVFPTRLTKDGVSFLKNSVGNSGHLAFWGNLKLVYDDFEQSKKLRTVHVNKAGEYFF